MFCHKFQLEFALEKYLESNLENVGPKRADGFRSQFTIIGLRTSESGPLSTLEKTKAKKQAVQVRNSVYPSNRSFWQKKRCSALAQAFRVERAGIEQPMTPCRERKSQGIPQTP